LAIPPPTKKAIAIPIWLKFNDVAVAVALSSLANHVTEKIGGCANPINNVPNGEELIITDRDVSSLELFCEVYLVPSIP
jgi:hypothetical protein